jgi:hypothetical protein
MLAHQHRVCWHVIGIAHQLALPASGPGVTCTRWYTRIRILCSSITSSVSTAPTGTVTHMALSRLSAN